MAEFKHIYVNEIENEKEVEKKSVFRLLLDILLSPGKHICMFFIPNVEEDELGKFWVPIMPLTSVIACIVLTKRTKRLI